MHISLCKFSSICGRKLTFYIPLQGTHYKPHRQYCLHLLIVAWIF